MSPIDRRFLSVFDYGTILVLACLLVIGVVLVASASQGQNLDPAPRQGLWVAVAPALALLMAIPLLGEIPSWISVAGVVIVTAGILVTLGPNLIQSAAVPAAREESERT